LTKLAGREEVSDDLSHLLRSADAAEGVQAAHLLLDPLPFCEERLVALGRNRAQSDSVGANTRMC
jgi:hypothetical protein